MSKRELTSYEQRQLNEEKIQHYREIFSEFDKDGDGTLALKYIGTIMRMLGQSPTESELKNIIIEVDTDGSGCMDFQEFLNMMAHYIKEETDTKEDICTAFKAFDGTGNGVIPVGELKHVLTTLGDALTAEEIDELIKAADVEDTGRVKYEDFVTKMMAGEKNEKKVEVVEETKEKKE